MPRSKYGFDSRYPLMKKNGMIIGMALGVVFFLIAFIYWLTPAGSLPSFMPGFEAGSTVVHFKHGLAAFILGLGAFVYGWFAIGKRSV